MGDYPPLLPTAQAARYCGFKTTDGLRKAYERGKIRPVGRRGGDGPFMWRRTDLDRFLMGLGDDVPVPENQTLAKTVLGNGVSGDVTKALIAPLLNRTK